MAEPNAAAPSRRKLPRELNTRVVEVRQETPDTVTLVLGTDAEHRDYKAGQFVNVDPKQFRALDQLVAYLQHQKGKKELVRAYSLTSAPHEEHLAITVKVESFTPEHDKYPPLLSPYLVHCVRPGDPMVVGGFYGPYTLPDDVDAQAKQVLHVVAGSGAVPNFAMVKDALHRGLAVRHLFVTSNKTWADICFREELDALERAHPDKLRAIYLLTREPEGRVYDQRVRQGRVSEALLRELVPDVPSTLAYVCGAAISTWERRRALETNTQAVPKFLESVIGLLQGMGFDNKRIKREAYG